VEFAGDAMMRLKPLPARQHRLRMARADLRDGLRATWRSISEVT